MAARDISFASFNLLNLQVPGQAIYGDTDGWDTEVYDRKVGFTSWTFQRLAADVIGLQELWAGAALDQVLIEAGMQDSYTALVPPGHNGKRIVCAAVVRNEMLVGEPKWIINFPDEYVLKSGGDDPQQGNPPIFKGVQP